MADNIVQQIARIIDPIAFKSWRESFEYNQRQGDDEETARRYADASYRRTCDEALAKADTILALPALIAKAERVDAMEAAPTERGTAIVKGLDWHTRLIETLEMAAKLSCGQYNDNGYELKQRLDWTHEYVTAELTAARNALSPKESE